MGIIKRCELCVNFFDCDIHDKVCDNLRFLQNFFDIEESEDIAKYCKSHVGYPRSNLRRLNKRLKKHIITDLETGKDISELVEVSFLGLDQPKVDDDPSSVKYRKYRIMHKRIENAKNLICRCEKKIEITVPMYVDKDDIFVCKTCFIKLKRELIHRKIDSNWKPEPIEIIKKKGSELGKILIMEDKWLIKEVFLADMINLLYEQCEIDKKKEIIVKIITRHHICVKIKKGDIVIRDESETINGSSDLISCGRIPVPAPEKDLGLFLPLSSFPYTSTEAPFEAKYQEIWYNNKRAKVIEFIKTQFKHSFSIVLGPKTIKIGDNKFSKIFLVSNLNNFQLKLIEMKKAKDFPFNLEKENLKVFLTINNSVVVELLENIKGSNWRD